MASVKANRFNIKRIVYAEVKKDDATAYNHGEIKVLGAPMTAQFTPTFATGPLYGGGVKTEDMTKITGGALKIDVNKVPIETRADIYNHTFTSGVMEANKDDQPKDIAIGIEIEQTSNKSELIWFPKCKAKPFGNNNQQSTENINYSIDSIEISVMARENDGAVYFIGDTANSDFTDEDAATFLDTPGGTLVTGA